MVANIQNVAVGHLPLQESARTANWTDVRKEEREEESEMVSVIDGRTGR